MSSLFLGHPCSIQGQRRCAAQPELIRMIEITMARALYLASPRRQCGRRRSNHTKRGKRMRHRWQTTRSLARLGCGVSAALAVVVAIAVVDLGSARADGDPAPDPAGIATGDRASVFDAGGNTFVVSEPTDPKAEDYADKKTAFDTYQTQAEREPLAVKLADAVGHIRLATNFAWTLNTGYLVLFMQAGFALLTCGLVRKRNAGHLMMLNFAAYVFAFLAYYAVGFAFQFGAVAVNAAPLNIGGTPTLDRFL